MGAWKYIAILLFLVACAPVIKEEFTPVTVDTLVVSDAPAETPVVIDKPTFDSLNISVVGDKATFLTRELNEGQWAKYSITTTEEGVSPAVRSYSMISTYYKSDPCIGIERNSTRIGESRTQTLWCDDTKYLIIWNERRGAFSDAQVLGRNSRWAEESIQGFSATTPVLDGLEQVTVPAGTFWVLHKSSFDGATRKDIWASPLVPGFESGLVKSIIISDGIKTTTELIEYHLE